MLDVGLALLSHDVGCRNLPTCQSEVRNVSSVQLDIYMVIHVVFLSWVCFQIVYDFVGCEFWCSVWRTRLLDDPWTIFEVSKGKGHLLILCMYTLSYIVELWILNRGHRRYRKTTINSTRIFRYSDCQKNQAKCLNSPLFLQLSLSGGTPEQMAPNKTKMPSASCPQLTPCIAWNTVSLKSCPRIRDIEHISNRQNQFNKFLLALLHVLELP